MGVAGASPTPRPARPRCCGPYAAVADKGHLVLPVEQDGQRVIRQRDIGKPAQIAAQHIVVAVDHQAVDVLLRHFGPHRAPAPLQFLVGDVVAVTLRHVVNHKLESPLFHFMKSYFNLYLSYHRSPDFVNAFLRESLPFRGRQSRTPRAVIRSNPRFFVQKICRKALDAQSSATLSLESLYKIQF